MTKRKTLLAAENQWERTAAYYIYLNRFHENCQAVGARVHSICIFHGTHPLVSDGDVLILISANGMAQRYGMTGITSKGARLNDYHLPLRSGFELVQLPEDFTGMQWNAPDIGRYVADLRASFLSRVSAYSPATSHCKTSFGIDTNEVTCFGLYKSGRNSTSTRMLDYREYFRFYPDGSVVLTHDFNHQGWGISGDPERTSPEKQVHKYAPAMGAVHIEGRYVSFELFTWGEVFFARYEGYFENGRLWLSRESPHSKVSRGKLPYRFHPFNPDAF